MVRRRRFCEGIVNDAVNQFKRIAFCIQGGGFYDPFNAPRLSNRRFRELFSCSSTICANAWLLMIDRWNDKLSLATKDKFLWALNLLKAYDTKKGNSSTNVREVCNKKTF